MDGHPGRQLIWQVIQLPPTVDRHQDAAGALLDGRFNDGHGVEEGFEGAAQVQAAGDSESALDAFLEERRAQCEQYADADRGTALGAVECPQLNSTPSSPIV